MGHLRMTNGNMQSMNVSEANQSEESPMKHLLDLIMSCSFWVFVLIFIFCPGALSEQINITARVGSTAVLPCDCSNETKEHSSSQSPHVEWRNVSDTVFERSGEKVYQSEEYKGRVDVPEDQLLKGNCSLVMKNVRAEDEGVYECNLFVKKDGGGESKLVILHV
ncbi:butyrophilin subfamily 1 member A1-like [Hoplias malabaricus]|uniref:butyrophilin subfamily 1 member A1-like n=1 Tax=Hoplias malabaricus TaxID=27720 RepID=UPI003462123A